MSGMRIKKELLAVFSFPNVTNGEFERSEELSSSSQNL